MLAELLENDAHRMHDFLLRFLDSSAHDLGQIEQALVHEDFASLGRLGHHARSPASMVGADGFAALCTELETHAHAQDARQAHIIAVRMRKLLVAIQHVMEQRWP